MDGFINGPDRIHPMPLEIMFGLLQMHSRIAQRFQGSFNLRMSSSA